mgnify:CR=1 FL=1
MVCGRSALGSSEGAVGFGDLCDMLGILPGQLFRKIALLLDLVAFVTYINHPDSTVEHELKALLTCFIGCGCSLVASLFPYPILAKRYRGSVFRQCD